MAGLTEMTANTGQDRSPDLDRLRDFIAERDRNAAWFFVGRSAEIDEIEETCALAFRRFREGKALAGATRLFQGAPGAGKTALLKHLQEKWAQCGRRQPYALLVDPPDTGRSGCDLVLALPKLLDPDKAQQFRQTVRAAVSHCRSRPAERQRDTGDGDRAAARRPLRSPSHVPARGLGPSGLPYGG